MLLTLLNNVHVRQPAKIASSLGPTSRLVVRDVTDGGRARGVERAAAPEREPGRRLVDVELSKEDVRKELSLRILAQIY